MPQSGFIRVFKEKSDWSDDFNPFIEVQRKHDREQEALAPLFAKEKGLVVIERETMHSDVTSTSTSSIKYKLFKAALRKNLVKMNLFKSKSAGIPQVKASSTRSHWCDIDDEEICAQDIKISLEELSSTGPVSV